MKINYGKISRLLLMCLVILLLLMVTAHANESVSLKFNSHELQADVYVKEGVSYISAQSLMKIPGIEVEEEGYIPLRKFFETGAGIVHWDHGKKQVIVSWREKKDGWLADELVMESSQIMQELNTYKMKGNATIKMAVYGSDQDSRIYRK